MSSAALVLCTVNLMAVVTTNEQSTWTRFRYSIFTDVNIAIERARLPPLLSLSFSHQFRFAVCRFEHVFFRWFVGSFNFFFFFRFFFFFSILFCILSFVHSFRFFFVLSHPLLVRSSLCWLLLLRLLQRAYISPARHFMWIRQQKIIKIDLRLKLYVRKRWRMAFNLSTKEKISSVRHQKLTFRHPFWVEYYWFFINWNFR